MKNVWRRVLCVSLLCFVGFLSLNPLKVNASIADFENARLRAGEVLRKELGIEYDSLGRNEINYYLNKIRKDEYFKQLTKGGITYAEGYKVVGLPIDGFDDDFVVVAGMLSHNQEFNCIFYGGDIQLISITDADQKKDKLFVTYIINDQVIEKEFSLQETLNSNFNYLMNVEETIHSYKNGEDTDCGCEAKDENIELVPMNFSWQSFWCSIAGGIACFPLCIGFAAVPVAGIGLVSFCELLCSGAWSGLKLC